MTVDQLRELLEDLEDTRELVMSTELAGDDDALFVAWGAARAEANLAYDEWSRKRTTEAYSFYRAAEDRADAAQDALSVRSASKWRSSCRRRGDC